MPAGWKVADVVELLKYGKSGEEAKHFRPVSLLNHTLKCFEVMLFHESREDFTLIANKAPRGSTAILMI